MESQVFTFCMPDIGEGVVEGEIVEWLKKEGDIIAKDEAVVSLMTDKATVELPTPYPGKLIRRYYHEGEIAYKDKPLYDIEVDSKVEIIHEKKCHEDKILKKCGFQESKKETSLSKLHESDSTPSKAFAIPKVRHLAKQIGVDLATIHGTGNFGRITEDDLRNSIKNQSGEALVLHLNGDEELPLVGIRGLMAKRMEKTHIPQFSYFEQVEVMRLLDMHSKFKVKADEEGVNLSFMPFFIRSLSLTIKKFPLLNASIDMPHSKAIVHKVQNIGIAMASEQGLIVPVLKGVENMGLNEIVRRFDELKKRAKDGSLTSIEMKQATITISNFGVLGDGLFATPMVKESESAILAVAKMRDMPVVKDNSVVIRKILPLSWSFDHRLIDGELAAKISSYYCKLLLEPASLL